MAGSAEILETDLPGELGVRTREIDRIFLRYWIVGFFIRYGSGLIDLFQIVRIRFQGILEG